MGNSDWRRSRLRVSPECSIYCEIGSEARISRCAREREREEGRRGETRVLNRARIGDELRRNGGLRRSIAAAWWRFSNGKKGEERGVRGLLIAGFGGRLAHGKERGEWS
jgi:Lon protease-like protein